MFCLIHIKEKNRIFFFAEMQNVMMRAEDGLKSGEKFPYSVVSMEKKCEKSRVPCCEGWFVSSFLTCGSKSIR